MKILSVVFLNAVPDLRSGETANSFAASELVRYGGYSFESAEDGIACRHPKSTVTRLVPWQNVRYCDVAEESAEPMPTGPLLPHGALLPKPDKRTKAYRASLPTKPEIE